MAVSNPEPVPATPRSRRPIRVAFVVEQHLGLKTYADNLRRSLAEVPDLETNWYPVEYEAQGWWDRVPSMPSSLRAMLRGRTESRRVLAATSGPTRFDATVFNTQVPAVIGGRAVRRDPFFLCTDVTPMQYDAMAAGYDHRADRTGPIKWWKHAQNQRAFRAAACNLVWSSWVRESLIVDYGVESSKVEVVPPGVDTEVWLPGDHSGDGPLKILFVGGDFRRKGGLTLLEAFHRLEAGSAELTIVTRSEVTPGEHVRVVDNLSANDPRLIDLYCRSDVFALPSHAETFGIAYVEASAAGLPVIGSRMGGVADIIVDGETGFTVSPLDSGELAARLALLAAEPDLRRQFGRAARARAVQCFDATTNAHRLIEIVRRHARGWNGGEGAQNRGATRL